MHVSVYIYTADYCINKIFLSIHMKCYVIKCNDAFKSNSPANRWRQVTVFMSESLSHSHDSFKWLIKWRIRQVTEWVIESLIYPIRSKTMNLSVTKHSCVAWRCAIVLVLAFFLYFANYFRRQNRAKIVNIVSKVTKKLN